MMNSSGTIVYRSLQPTTVPFVLQENRGVMKTVTLPLETYSETCFKEANVCLLYAEDAFGYTLELSPPHKVTNTISEIAL